jgi:phage protein U
MAAEILMTLGGFQFAINTAAHDSLQRETAYRWEQQDRLGREPAMQFIGAGNEKISLQGRIYPHFRGGLGQLNTMRQMAGEGEPLQLIDGLGNVLGQYCITRIVEGQQAYVGPGIPRRMDFAIELERYGADQLAGNGGDGSGGGGWFGSFFGLFT